MDIADRSRIRNQQASRPQIMIQVMAVLLKFRGQPAIEHNHVVSLDQRVDLRQTQQDKLHMGERSTGNRVGLNLQVNVRSYRREQPQREIDRVIGHRVSIQPENASRRLPNDERSRPVDLLAAAYRRINDNPCVTPRPPTSKARAAEGQDRRSQRTTVGFVEDAVVVCCC